MFICKYLSVSTSDRLIKSSSKHQNKWSFKPSRALCEQSGVLSSQKFSGANINDIRLVFLGKRPWQINAVRGNEVIRFWINYIYLKFIV